MLYALILAGGWMIASKEIHFSMYYAEHFVFRNFRLFLHCL